MKSTRSTVTFYFNGTPVGHFEQGVYPTTDGQYRYMPFRGLGHLEMQKALERGDEVRCAYQTGFAQKSVHIM